jgi:hypothetical protein
MDMQLSTERLAKFNSDLGVLSNYDYTTTPEELQRYIQNEIQGSDALVKNNLETIFYDNTNAYIDSSFNSLVMNNMNNMSSFVNENLMTSEQKMKALHDNIKNQISRSRLHSSDSQWMLNYYKYVRFLLVFTSFVILCGHILLYSYLRQLGSEKLIFSLAGVLIFVFVIFIIINIYRRSKRRQDDWNKFNFSFKPNDD